MKKVILITFSVLLASSIAEAKKPTTKRKPASIHVTCGETYGPTENNLEVLFDDEDKPNDILQIGYKVDGEFFPMKLAGCKTLQQKDSDLLCDSASVGKITSTYVATDTGSYEGPRGSVKLKSFDISGSCGKKGDPLTIKIFK